MIQNRNNFTPFAVKNNLFNKIRVASQLKNDKVKKSFFLFHSTSIVKQLIIKNISLVN